jgi:hypothetical protein
VIRGPEAIGGAYQDVCVRESYRGPVTGLWKKALLNRLKAGAFDHII